MARYNSPDIYFERLHKPESMSSLRQVRIDRAAFFGFTERGPIQEPVQISSWEQFQDIFGDLYEDAYLPFSVHGFFRNGGSECFVVRVANTEAEAPERCAKRSEAIIRDLYGRPTIRLASVNEGSWGNRVKIRLQPPKNPRITAVTGGVARGATSCRVDMTKGFTPGTVVRISDGKYLEEYRVVQEVKRGELGWAADEPIRLRFEKASRLSVEAIEFRMIVSYGDSYEIHDQLSMHPTAPNYFVKVINDASAFVRAEDMESRTSHPFSMPQLGVELVLGGGRDGIATARPEDFLGVDCGPGERTGLQLLREVEEIGIVVLPDLFRAQQAAGWTDDEVYAIQRAAIDMAEAIKTFFVVLDPPPGLSPSQVFQWRERIDTKYAAVYYPWIVVPDALAPRNGKTRVLPPSGHVTGIYAATDNVDGVHRAPANKEVNEVIALQYPLSKDDQDELNPVGINCFRSFQGRGIRVWGARTLSSDPLWRYVSVRRIFIMIERSVEEGTQWSVFEPNDFSLWKSVDRQVSQFLYQLWKQGYMKGETPEEAFYVKCDEETNPEEVREAGQVICEVGVAAVRPAEFIVFRIGQRTQDIILEEPVS